MTEIREVIWEFLVDYDKDNSNPAVDWAFILLHRLHSQGVVIKVESPLPDISYHSAYPENEERYQQAMLEAGYVATEPLI